MCDSAMTPSDQLLRGMLTAAPDALLAVDPSGRIVYVSDQVERLFGWNADELLGQQVDVLVPDDIAIRHAGHRSGFVAEPSARPMGAGMQVLGLRKDGRTFPAEISLGTVNDADGSLLVLAAVRDVSERLEGLGQLAAGIAHDFNNHLGVILNYITLLSRRLGDEQAAADLGEIRSAAEHAAALTHQLLALARRDDVCHE